MADGFAKRGDAAQHHQWVDIVCKLSCYGADFAPRVETLKAKMLRALTNCGETALFLAARAGHMSVTPVPRWMHAARPSAGGDWQTPDDDVPKSKFTPLLMKPGNPTSGTCTSRAIVALCAYHGAKVSPAESARAHAPSSESPSSSSSPSSERSE